MDARVKGALRVGVVGLHGGGAGARWPARRQRRLVTLRCAGWDRMTVSGRELPRTSDASSRMSVRYRIDTSRFLTGGRRRPPSPSVHRPVGGSGGAGYLLRLLAERLPGHRRPEEAAELAGDGDGGDGGKLALSGEVAVTVVEADLRLPGAGERLGRDEAVVGADAGRQAGRVLGVASRLGEAAVGGGGGWRRSGVAGCG